MEITHTQTTVAEWWRSDEGTHATRGWLQGLKRDRRGAKTTNSQQVHDLSSAIVLGPNKTFARPVNISNKLHMGINRIRRSTNVRVQIDFLTTTTESLLVNLRSFRLHRPRCWGIREIRIADSPRRQLRTTQRAHVISYYVKTPRVRTTTCYVHPFLYDLIRVCIILYRAKNIRSYRFSHSRTLRQCKVLRQLQSSPHHIIVNNSMRVLDYCNDSWRK